MKILVIGDSCTDVFVYGEINRFCPEAPVPVFQPIRQVENGGMARNVKRNLEVLGVDVEIVTNDNGMKKTRYVDWDSNQLIMRLDENDICDRIQDLMEIPMWTFDAIVVSDYHKGFLTEDDIEFICKNHDDVFVDTKKQFGEWLYDAKYIKINSMEYDQNVNKINNRSDSLKDKLIITRGRYGCEFNGDMFKVKDVPIKDVAGAGDTFLSALTFDYMKNRDIIKAIKFAQKCTTEVVQKIGVSTV